MKKWMITTALSALAMPVLGQAGGAPAATAAPGALPPTPAATTPPPAAPATPAEVNRDDPKPQADQVEAAKREQIRRAVIDLGGGIGIEGGAGGPQGQIIVEDVRGGDGGNAVLRTYRLAPGGAMGGMAGMPTRPVKKEKVTYLGVVTSSAPASIREQLKLGRGVGLVVDSVEAKTSAEAAGIKQHDVLEKLNDQLLINTEQFTAVLRSMKVGDEVMLSIIRQGEKQSIKAKLGEKEVETGGGPLVFNTAVAPPAPMVAGDNVIFLGPGGDVMMGGNGAAGAGAAAVWTPQVVRAGGGPVNFVATLDGKQTTNWADDQFQITVERENGNVSKVSVFDKKTGKLMLTGTPPAADDVIFKDHPDLAGKVKLAIAAAEVQPTPVRTGGMEAVVARGKVVQWQDGDHVLVVRMMANKPLYLLALSKKDGRTLYDGPVMTDEQRQSVPAEVSEQFEMLSAHPETAKEFGAKEPKAPAKDAHKEKVFDDIKK